MWRIATSTLLSVALLMPQTENLEAQQLITNCGASKGKAFYLEPQREGWVDDGMSAGSITFMRYPGGQLDVITKDAMRSFSAREDGATIVRSHGSDNGAMTLIVAYPQNVVEVYQLTVNGQGHGTLIWSSMKNRAGPANVTKGSVFISDCAR